MFILINRAISSHIPSCISDKTNDIIIVFPFGCKLG